MARKRKLGRNVTLTGTFNPPSFEEFVESGMAIFWLGHGANFLASDFEEGIWRQPFDVYQGAPITVEKMQEQVALFKEQGDEALLLWVQQPPEIVYDVYKTMWKTFGKGMTTDRVAGLNYPANPNVWDVFAYIKQAGLEYFFHQYYVETEDDDTAHVDAVPHVDSAETLTAPPGS